jgi:hypothetical protein
MNKEEDGNIMKKLISLVCVALLVCTMTVSALANDSPASVQPAPVTEEAIEQIDNQTVRDVVALVNVEDNATVANVMGILASSENKTEDEVELTEDAIIVSDFAFISTKGEEVELEYGLLNENPEDYVLLVVAPDGSYAFVKLDSNNVKDGRFIGKLPFENCFVVLIKK